MKRAVVLAGGGSRGAYQMGAWTALQENGIEFDLVTGASIGALNGALMAQGDYEAAKTLWETITLDSVMENGINLEYSIESMLNQRGNLMPFLKKYIYHKGADITPLKRLIDKNVQEARLRSSRVGFGLVTVQFPSLKPVELAKEKIPQGQLKDFLLASASCFPAFPMSKIEGKTYIDGGYYDNMPVRFALELGAEEIVAIDLNERFTHREYADMPYVTYIKPSRPLGSFLLFDRKRMNDNMQLGYLDAQKAFGRYFGFRYAFEENLAEREYKGQAKEYAGRIARLDAAISDKKISAIVKTSGSPLMESLSENTWRPLGYFDILVRGIELCAEILGVNPLKAYYFTELLELLREQLDQIGCGTREALYLTLRGARLPAEFLNAIKLAGAEQALACIYAQMKNGTASEYDMDWMSASMPKEFAAALALKLLS